MTPWYCYLRAVSIPMLHWIGRICESQVPTCKGPWQNQVFRLGWSIRHSYLLSTRICKAPDTKWVYRFRFEWVHIKSFFPLCVRERESEKDGEKELTTYIKRNYGKNKFLILGFPKNLILNLHCLLSVISRRKQLLESLPFTAESSSEDLVQLDFTEMTGSVSDLNSEDFLLCLVVRAKFLCA